MSNNQKPSENLGKRTHSQRGSPNGSPNGTAGNRRETKHVRFSDGKPTYASVVKKGTPSPNVTIGNEERETKQVRFGEGKPTYASVAKKGTPPPSEPSRGASTSQNPARQGAPFEGTLMGLNPASAPNDTNFTKAKCTNSGLGVEDVATITYASVAKKGLCFGTSCHFPFGINPVQPVLPFACDNFGITLGFPFQEVTPDDVSFDFGRFCQPFAFMARSKRKKTPLSASTRERFKTTEGGGTSPNGNRDPTDQEKFAAGLRDAGDATKNSSTAKHFESVLEIDTVRAKFAARVKEIKEMGKELLENSPTNVWAIHIAGKYVVYTSIVAQHMEPALLYQVAMDCSISQAMLGVDYNLVLFGTGKKWTIDGMLTTSSMQLSHQMRSTGHPKVEQSLQKDTDIVKDFLVALRRALQHQLDEKTKIEDNFVFTKVNKCMKDSTVDIRKYQRAISDCRVVFKPILFWGMMSIAMEVGASKVLGDVAVRVMDKLCDHVLEYSWNCRDMKELKTRLDPIALEWKLTAIYYHSKRFKGEAFIVGEHRHSLYELLSLELYNHFSKNQSPPPFSADDYDRNNPPTYLPGQEKIQDICREEVVLKKRKTSATPASIATPASSSTKKDKPSAAPPPATATRTSESRESTPPPPPRISTAWTDSHFGNIEFCSEAGYEMERTITFVDGRLYFGGIYIAGTHEDATNNLSVPKRARKKGVYKANEDDAKWLRSILWQIKREESDTTADCAKHFLEDVSDFASRALIFFNYEPLLGLATRLCTDCVENSTWIDESNWKETYSAKIICGLVYLVGMGDAVDNRVGFTSTVMVQRVAYLLGNDGIKFRNLFTEGPIDLTKYETKDPADATKSTRMDIYSTMAVLDFFRGCFQNGWRQFKIPPQYEVAGDWWTLYRLVHEEMMRNPPMKMVDIHMVQLLHAFAKSADSALTSRSACTWATAVTVSYLGLTPFSYSMDKYDADQLALTNHYLARLFKPSEVATHDDAISSLVTLLIWEDWGRDLETTGFREFFKEISATPGYKKSSWLRGMHAITAIQDILADNRDPFKLKEVAGEIYDRGAFKMYFVANDGAEVTRDEDKTGPSSTTRPRTRSERAAASQTPGESNATKQAVTPEDANNTDNATAPVTPANLGDKIGNM